MAPRETENNAYAKFLGDKQRALWFVMVFSGVVNYLDFITDDRKLILMTRQQKCWILAFLNSVSSQK